MSADSGITLPNVKVRDPRAIRQALEEIRRAHPEGLLVMEQVVEAAKDPDSPMHGYFTWDIDQAAHQHWLNQARALVRTIEVIMPDDPDEAPVPRYVSLRSDRQRPGGGYRETSEVLNNKELLEELERTAQKDVEMVLARYKMLQSFVDRVRKAMKKSKKD